MNFPLLTKRALAALTLSIPLAACGGSSSPAANDAASNNDGGSDSTSLSDASIDGAAVAAIAQACSDNAAAVCTKRQSCDPDNFNQRYGSIAACEALQIQSCTLSQEAPSTSASPSRLALCTTAYGSESCSDFENDNLPPVCGAEPGLLASGATCTFNGQCQSAFCAVGQNASCGICATAPTTGSSCAANGCPVQLECAKDMTCKPYGAASTSCDEDTPCGYGLSCVGTAGSKTCQTDAALGASCDPNEKTEPNCQHTIGAWCLVPTGSKTGTCVAITYSGATGSTCAEQPDGSYIGCVAGDSCEDIDATTHAGTCKLLSTVGQPCDTAIGPSCQSPARCIVPGAVTDGDAGITASDASTDSGADAAAGTGPAPVTAGTCALLDPSICH